VPRPSARASSSACDRHRPSARPPDPVPALEQEQWNPWAVDLTANKGAVAEPLSDQDEASSTGRSGNNLSLASSVDGGRPSARKGSPRGTVGDFFRYTTAIHRATEGHPNRRPRGIGGTGRVRACCLARSETSCAGRSGRAWALRRICSPECLRRVDERSRRCSVVARQSVVGECLPTTPSRQQSCGIAGRSQGRYPAHRDEWRPRGRPARFRRTGSSRSAGRTLWPCRLAAGRSRSARCRRVIRSSLWGCGLGRGQPCRSVSGSGRSGRRWRGGTVRLC
jgi:hypothetical protein